MKCSPTGVCRLICLALVAAWHPAAITADDAPAQSAEMAGYLIVPHDKVPRTFNAGFSMYVAAWPLLKNYPGQDFQSGLFGTWMFAQGQRAHWGSLAE